MRTMVILFGVASVGALRAQTRSIPDAFLEIATQQVEDGQKNPGFHVFKLQCYRSDCFLLTTSLNQCGRTGESVDGFYPRVEIATTAAGDLTVTDDGKTLRAIVTGLDVGGSYTMTLRFGYTKAQNILHLKSFSGALVKNSDLVDRVVTLVYAPLPRPHQVVRLDCGALLPGLPRP